RKGFRGVKLGDVVIYFIDDHYYEGIVTQKRSINNIIVKNNNTTYHKITIKNIKFNISYEGNMRFLLYNILSAQLDEIYCSLKKLKDMMRFLFEAKYNYLKQISNNEFIDKSLNIFNKYVKNEL